MALRIARAVTGGTGFIVTENAYHGNTLAVTEISPSSASAEPRNPHVFLVPAPDTYRTRSKDVGPLFAANIMKAIAAMKRKKIRFAGLVADSIFSSDGIYPGQPGSWPKPSRVCAKPVACSLPTRCSQASPAPGEMWGFERHGIVPDMVAMGKPMGNGYPIGGVAVEPDLLETFGATAGYFNTFGGNPVAAAAGLAVLETLEAEKLQQNALEIGTYLLAELNVVARRFKCVGDVRGKGLYIGVELVRDRKIKEAGQGHGNPRRGNTPRSQYPGRHCRPLWQHPQDPPAAHVRARARRHFGEGAVGLTRWSLLLSPCPLPPVCLERRGDLVEDGGIVDGRRHLPVLAVGDLRMVPRRILPERVLGRRLTSSPS